jgi:hypothetical protein
MASESLSGRLRGQSLGSLRSCAGQVWRAKSVIRPIRSLLPDTKPRLIDACIHIFSVEEGQPPVKPRTGRNWTGERAERRIGCGAGIGKKVLGIVHAKADRRGKVVRGVLKRGGKALQGRRAIKC